MASRTLGIVLTKRGKHGGMDIPMCGVPVVRADEYLQRLIAAGHRVAVCEQLEDPAEARKRGSKAVVKRDVVRIVTPGTITEDGLLDARRANMLAAVAARSVQAAAMIMLSQRQISRPAKRRCCRSLSVISPARSRGSTRPNCWFPTRSVMTRPVHRCSRSPGPPLPGWRGTGSTGFGRKPHRNLFRRHHARSLRGFLGGRTLGFRRHPDLSRPHPARQGRSLATAAPVGFRSVHAD